MAPRYGPYCFNNLPLILGPLPQLCRRWGSRKDWEYYILVGHAKAFITQEEAFRLGTEATPTENRRYYADLEDETVEAIPVAWGYPDTSDHRHREDALRELHAYLVRKLKRLRDQHAEVVKDEERRLDQIWYQIQAHEAIGPGIA